MGTRTSNAVFGPVSSVVSAPVRIGNSMTGSSPVVKATKDGVRVQGRDYLFQLAAVNSIQTNWVLVGGSPLIPHAIVASSMRSLASMYSEFTVHGFTFHYITSSPTNASGDVMFYINKDRGAALLDTSNANFMSIVLSDPNTVMGPLWQNNSATYRPIFKTYTTSILNDEPLHNEGPGEVFIYAKQDKSSALGSPGYVIVDFDITFKTLQTNPRDLLFPVARMKYTQYGLGYATPASLTAGAEAVVRTNATMLDGGTNIISNDSASRLGDVFKIVMCPQYGAYSGITPATMLLYSARAGAPQPNTVLINTQLTIDDGFTCYGVYVAVSNGVLMLYPTYQAAMSQSFPYLFAITGTAQWTIPSWISLVGNVGAIAYQSNF